MAAFLEMTGISKQFPSVLANDNIDFAVDRGEVHALLGENGAGKSTLVSILYGLLTPTSGRIRFNGQTVRIKSPRIALDLGIGMVHQHFMLIPALTVVENIVLGMAHGRNPVLNLGKAADKVRALSEKYGLRVDPHVKVWQLSVGEQQRVEIIKALFRGADLLILDEPTAVLTPRESADLFGVIRRLTAEGHAVVFISHKLNEVMAISDRVTVLRGGKAVGTVVTGTTGPSALARMMVGRDVLFQVRKTPANPGPVVLEVRHLEAMSKRGLKALKDVSLSVRAGEILGVAGVDGNGQAELIGAIAGLQRATAGRIAVAGVEITNASPRQILARKVSHVPGDRQTLGLVPGMDLKENAIMQTYYRAPYTRGLFLDWGEIRRHARALIQEYDVRAPGEDVPVRQLSGGNQQRLILARELSRHPALLLAMYPTRGLDVGATEFVHQQIIKARDEGSAVLLVSIDLDEIVGLSDRIAVMFEGEIMGTLDGDEADLQRIGLMMAGSRQTAS